ncbi:MAG: hypothetical protein AABX23_00070 [Nanoarchaeota archaeon]
MTRDLTLTVTNCYKRGNLVRTSFYANDIGFDCKTIPELAQDLRSNYPKLVGADSTYRNARQEDCEIIISEPGEVLIDRPFTQSELELFAQELSKPKEMSKPRRTGRIPFPPQD